MKDAVVEYVDPLAKDEKLRERLATALVAGVAARNRLRRHTGASGLARRIAGDPVFRAQVAEMAAALQGAQKRAKKTHSHRLRTTLLLLAGAGGVAAAVAVARRRRDDWAPTGWTDVVPTKPATVEEEIEVDVPVSAAYERWTRFEEFPRFMEGVDEVRRLDDSLLHWAATVAGKHAEWDAKIVEQEPDRRITWESTDGKQTRGTVSFEEAGPQRSRIQLRMSYTPDSLGEKVGSAIGLDNRRIRGDLERFRELVETGSETARS